MVVRRLGRLHPGADPMSIRFSPARCCCGCENSLKILRSNGTAYAGALVHVYEWDGSTTPQRAGALVFTGTTDAAGLVQVDLPYAFYQVVVRAGFSDEIRKLVLIRCGAQETIRYSNRTVYFVVNGCFNDLPGAVVTVHRGDGGDFVQPGGFGGWATWLPQEEGPYDYTITHPSGRFDDVTGSGVVPAEALSPWTTTVTRTLPPKSGYLCCNFDSSQPPNPKSGDQYLPVGPLLVTTSAGDSWTWTWSGGGCNGSRCTTTDKVPVGGALTSGSVPGSPPCLYDDFPTLTLGDVPCHVSFDTHGSKWTCRVWATKSAGLVRYDPMSYNACRNQFLTGNEMRRHKRWYTSGSCTSGVGVDYVEVEGTVNSTLPISVTFDFTKSTDAWEWTDTVNNPATHTTPPPIGTITVTELLT
jgi:hypothetical protein